MVQIGLDWLPGLAFAYLLIFARIGAMLMMMPAIGERLIPARMRLGFALAFSLMLYPLVSPGLPPSPASLEGLVVLLVHEIGVGLIFGTIARMIVMATQTAGAIIAFQTGFSTATAADPTQGGTQGAMLGTFLSLLGVTLIFATDLHHLILAAVYDSYTVFPVDAPFMFGDIARMAIDSFSKAFVIGVQISAPFIVFGLIFNVAVGVLSKLMPQIQVYFIAMPANIGFGLVLFAMLLTLMMGWYLSHFEQQFAMMRG